MSPMEQLRAGMAPYFDPLRERWEQMPPMDRLVWGGLGVLTMLVVLVFGIWAPSHRAMQKAQQESLNNQELLSYIESNAGRVRQGGDVANGGDPLLTVISNSAASNGFSLRRFEPQGDHVRIWLDGVAFNQVAGWLDQLSRQGITAVDAEVERQADTGLVSVTLTLSR